MGQENLTLRGRMEALTLDGTSYETCLDENISRCSSNRRTGCPFHSVRIRLSSSDGVGLAFMVVNDQDRPGLVLSGIAHDQILEVLKIRAPYVLGQRLHVAAIPGSRHRGHESVDRNCGKMVLGIQYALT